MKSVSLFFGSFNPIHIGHLVVANHVVENSQEDEVWLMVTPQNPHKNKASLLDERQRYEMVYLATASYPKLKPCDIEFTLSRPSYTVNTLAYLKEKFPEVRFSLILGEDNLSSFHKWKSCQYIASNYPVYVYPRYREAQKSEISFSKLTFIEAPRVEISSSMVREQIALGKNVRPLLPEKVWAYLDKTNFYTTPKNT